MDERQAADLARTAIRVMVEFLGLLRMKAVLREIKTQTGAQPRRVSG